MSPRRRPLPRRFAPLAALIVVVVGGGAVAAALLLGDDGEGGDGVELLPAAGPGRADFTDDLDLLDPDQRALPAGDRPQLPYVDLEEPVALAGLGIRGAEAGLYTATRDEPTCDVDRLGELLLGSGGDGEGGADPAATAWFAAVARNIGEDDRDDYIDDLTAVRLRVDTRVVAHTFADGRTSPYPAVLQAGTAVLVDPMGVPRVRCTGGTPLGEPDPASEDPAAGTPDGAWAGFDPAGVVVVEARVVEDGFEVAAADGRDEDGDETFVRAVGSNGDLDRGVFVPDDGEPLESCSEGCRELEIAVASGGATLTFEGVVQPSEIDDQRLFWREARPTTYKFTVAQPWKTFAEFALGEDLPPPPWNDPAVEGEEIILQPVDPTAPVPVNRLVECIPGPVSITVTVDGEVVRTIDQDVACGGPVDLEFALE